MRQGYDRRTGQRICRVLSWQNAVEWPGLTGAVKDVKDRVITANPSDYGPRTHTRGIHHANKEEGMSDPLNKAAIWHRVKDEGRLAEFDARRESIRNELRQKNVPRKESADRAWRVAAEEFAPLPVEETPADAQCEDDDGEWWQQQPGERLRPAPPYTSDTLWVYYMMCDQSTQQSDAPNPGAWALLQWGRCNRNAFYSQMLPKAVAAQEKETQEEEVRVKDEPKTVEERLAAYEDLMAQYEAKKRRLGLTGMQLLNARDGPPRPG